MQVESYSFEHALEDFSKINYKGFGNVTLKQGDNPMLKVSSKLDVQAAMKHKIVNGVLELKVKDSLSLGFKSLMKLESPDLKIEVIYKSLESIVFNGMGNIQNTGVLEGFELILDNNGVGSMRMNVDVKTLHSKLDGAGSLEVIGAAEEHTCKLNGAGKIDAHKLVAERAKVVSNGVGAVLIFASQKLDAKLVGIGNITHFGNPDKIESRIQGIGSILANN